LAATQALRLAYRTDVEPILAMSRLEKGGAIDLLGTYRAAGYRAKVAEIRPAVEGGSGGIV
jgi:L-rhamnose isomerase/sugar isomerase